MIVKQVYNTENKKQLLIDLPESFWKKRKVLVVLDDSVDTIADKKALMKAAKNDPLLQADIDEISDDFAAADGESL